MPVLIALAGAIAAVAFFIIRARNAAEAGSELLDMANDVRLAARRFGFRRKTNVHPADAIEDPNIALAGIAVAFLELDALPSADQQDALHRQLSSSLKHFGL